MRKLRPGAPYGSFSLGPQRTCKQVAALEHSIFADQIEGGVVGGKTRPKPLPDPARAKIKAALYEDR